MSVWPPPPTGGPPEPESRRGIDWKKAVKNGISLAATSAAVFLSILCFGLLAADPKPGAHPALPAWPFLLLIAAWLAVAGLNRWRKRS